MSISIIVQLSCFIFLLWSFWWYKLNYVGYISAAVSQGPGCLSLRCPDPSCSAMVLQGMFNKLAKQEDAEKYARFALRAYVEGSKKVNFLHNYLEGGTCLYCQRYWQFWNHVFSLLHGFVTLVVSCRLNGVQPLTVHARWNLLVMWTMMSHVIANTGFAGMWVLLLPFPIILLLLFFLVIWWFCYIFFFGFMIMCAFIHWCLLHFQCTEEAHRPLNCETVTKWILKNSAESENMNWFVTFSV